MEFLAHLSRRRMLQGMGALAATALLPAGMLPAYAAGPVNDDFALISRYLTGRNTLPDVFGTALFDAFVQFDADFPQRLSWPIQWITCNPVLAAYFTRRLPADRQLSYLACLPASSFAVR